MAPLLCLPSLICTDGGADLLLPGGGRYVGGLDANFKQHGEGTQYRQDRSEFASGQWRDGKQHGRGSQMIWNGCYEGDFVDGKFSGLGVEWTAGGRVTRCGRWADGELVESCPVPRSTIPFSKFLSAAGE